MSPMQISYMAPHAQSKRPPWGVAAGAETARGAARLRRRERYLGCMVVACEEAED